MINIKKIELIKKNLIEIAELSSFYNFFLNESKDYLLTANLKVMQPPYLVLKESESQAINRYLNNYIRPCMLIYFRFLKKMCLEGRKINDIKVLASSDAVIVCDMKYM